jgi:4-diphosphocytidyl-2-C-methyl-D-erythritol kinase
VFSALARRECPPGPPPPAAFRDFDELVAWLAEGRNDLEAAAVGLCPVIGEVLEALGDAPLARMSGSGATCFALWPDREAALAASERLRATRPGWWTAAAPVPASRPAPMAAQG